MKHSYKERDIEDALLSELTASREYEHLWRQVRTHRGVLDILGVTKEGVVCVWEIKREYITERDLVQMLGYRAAIQNIVSYRIADITPLDFFWSEIEVAGIVVGKGLHAKLVKRMFFEFDFSFTQYTHDDQGFHFTDIEAQNFEEVYDDKPAGPWVNKLALSVANGLARKRSRDYIQSAGSNPDINPTQSHTPNPVLADEAFAAIANNHIRRNGSDVMWRRNG